MAILIVSGMAGALLVPAAPTLAAPVANQDLAIYAGPGAEFDAIAYASAGAPISVDGDAVNGFFPVTYNGVSGWAADWTVSFDETAATDPLVETAADFVATEPVDLAPFVAEPVTGEPILSDPALLTPEPALAPAPAPISTEVAPAPINVEADTSYGAPVGDEDAIIQMIYEAADRYGQSRRDMLRVARCESGLNPNAVDPAGLYHGLFQFVPGTFAGTPYAGYDIYDPWANAHAAAWMWSEGRKGEWTCQ